MGRGQATCWDLQNVNTLEPTYRYLFPSLSRPDSTVKNKSQRMRLAWLRFIVECQKSSEAVFSLILKQPVIRTVIFSPSAQTVSSVCHGKGSKEWKEALFIPPESITSAIRGRGGSIDSRITSPFLSLSPFIKLGSLMRSRLNPQPSFSYPDQRGLPNRKGVGIFPPISAASISTPRDKWLVVFQVQKQIYPNHGLCNHPFLNSSPAPVPFAILFLFITDSLSPITFRTLNYNQSVSFFSSPREVRWIGRIT